MPWDLPASLDDVAWREVLGYLNFSSGAPDRRFRSQLNRLFALADGREAPAFRVVQDWLSQASRKYAGSTAAFADLSAADATREAVFERLLPGYLDYHRDLLHHQKPETLFNAFFVARAFETVLALRASGESERDVTTAALAQLNDFLGHRPLPVLQSTARHEPYAHERVRPVPLYLREAGVAWGRYHDLVTRAFASLQAIPELLRDTAHFDIEALDELAFDPRAYDFDHPVSKRPNYLFGQWDPHRVSPEGRYERFVLQQATLDALQSRIDEASPEERAGRLEEAGAVLAVTMLMAAMTSGRAPEAHDSTVSLATLVGRIAKLRDAAYDALLAQADEPLKTKLLQEAKQLQQPYGGARQHLNQRLARLRASQLQHVRVAELYARLGAGQLAARHVEAVPAASARMAAEIRCRITVADRLAADGRPREALAEIDVAEDCLLRGIECGALADPWNILGFQGQFSLFRAVENSVPDHRLELLIDRVEQLFGGWRRLAAQAAASGDDELAADAHERFQRRAEWWDQFAATTVDQVRPLSGREAFESSRHVAESLAAWHRGGTSTGDLAFWRQHVERFDSARAYAQVVEALLERGDLIAAQALLVQWLSEAHRVKLQEGDDSFHRLVGQWLRQAVDLPWARWKRFVELLEANADTWWEAPHLELGGAPRRAKPRREEPAQENADDDELYGAAYDQMTYRDSTADGIDADMLESGPAPPSDFELEHESQRLTGRVGLLATAAEVWQAGAARAARRDEADTDEREDRDAYLAQWVESAARQREGLAQLVDELHAFRLPRPGPSHESHLEYDRRFRLKEALLERIVLTLIAMIDGVRLLRAAQQNEAESVRQADAPLERAAVAVLRALAHRDAEAARAVMPGLFETLAPERILFVPLGKGGDPRQMVAAKGLQHLVRQLLHGLPRLGLLVETCQLLKTAQAMERNRPSGSRPVSDFDTLFREGLTNLVAALAAAHAAEDDGDLDLLESLRRWSRSLLKLWLRHSQSLRLSVLEGVRDERHWLTIRSFITTYGEGLFTQRFLNAGNLRAILDLGVEPYLRRLEEESPEEGPERLLKDLEAALPRKDAVACLELVIEAVVENHEEYLDYNSTTVQSDRGDKLYVLLDFLRLKAAYHRVAWNIRPLVWVHDELVRLARSQAADLWRRSIVEQTNQVADWHLKRLAELRAEHAVDLSSVGDRLAERFVQPLALARLRAIVAPAAAEMRSGAEGPACAELDAEIDELIAVPSGVRMGEPEWLETLEEEVDRLAALSRRPHAVTPSEAPRALSAEELDAQWQRWEQEASK